MFLLVTALGYLAVNLAFAQQYLGTVSGEIRDPSGAKLANAQITVIDEQTHFITPGKSNNAGSYSVPFLQPGTYTVRVESWGFTVSERTGVVISAGDNKEINFDLSIRNTAAVTVSSEAAVLDIGTANQGDTFSAKDVTDIPNLGRNPFNLVTLTEGIYSSVGAQSKMSASSQPFGGIATGVSAGGIPNAGRVTLNGIPDDPPERTVGRYTGFVPSPEAVQEVKIQTALYDSQYGHSGGAIINAVLRAGSSDYHGSAYYIFRNTYMDANTYERTGANLPRSNDQWNQPGAVLDGPIRIPHLYDGRDKSFFLVAFERIQDVLPQQYNPTVPSVKMRNGDFSELLDANGDCPAAPYTCIYDPLSVTASGIRTKFPHNDLSKRLDPVGKALINAYALPNAPGQGLNGLTRNYVSSQTSSPDTYYSLTLRLDQQINTSNKLTIAYLRNRRHQLKSNEGYPLGGGPGYVHQRNNEGGSVDLVTILSPKLVLDSRVGGIYHPFSLVYYGYNYDLASLGFPASLISQLPAPTFPAVSVSDGTTGLTGGASQFSGTTLLTASEILSQSIAKHSLRYGIQYEMMRYNINDPTPGLGSFGFNRLFTQRSATAGADSDPISGYGLASLALGYPSSGTQSTTTSSAYQQHYFAGFIQDDWRVSDKLTLNLGLRYDLELPLTERHDFSNAGFCTTCDNPLQAPGTPPVKGGLLFTDSSHRYPYKKDWNNIQPRFGMAYRLNEKQVLRAGFGITYPQTIDLPGNTGYSSSTTYTTSIDAIHPYTQVSNPYPNGLNVPTGRAGGLSTGLGQAITFMNQDRSIPRIYQTSLDVQTELPGQMVFQIGYAGTFGRSLSLNKNINALPAKYFSLGATYLQATVANPFAGLFPINATLNAATIQRRYLYLPYPEFGTITENGISEGSSNYNSMRVSLSKRFSQDFSLHANFTWLKLMKSDFLNDVDDAPTFYQDSQPNLLFTLTALYRLPTLNQRNIVERFILGGWQANLVVRKQNGALVANPANVIPLGDPHIGSQSYSKMFNTCYLTATGKPSTPSCAVGAAVFQQETNSAYVIQTIHPYMDRVRNIIKPNFDLSMFKVFRLHESQTFEIRGEFFNVLNSANFTAPDTTITALTYGSVTFTQVNDPRIGQLTARFNF